jgi:hypothetical protein
MERRSLERTDSLDVGQARLVELADGADHGIGDDGVFLALRIAHADLPLRRAFVEARFRHLGFEADVVD